MCENNMKILCLLSEEVFEFSDDMTSQKAQYMKNQLRDQFDSIFGVFIII